MFEERPRKMENVNSSETPHSVAHDFEDIPGFEVSQNFHPLLSQYLFEHLEDEKVLRKLILTEIQYRLGSFISIKDQEKNRWNILFHALWKRGELYPHNITKDTWQQLHFKASSISSAKEVEKTQKNLRSILMKRVSCWWNQQLITYPNCIGPVKKGEKRLRQGGDTGTPIICRNEKKPPTRELAFQCAHILIDITDPNSLIGTNPKDIHTNFVDWLFRNLSQKYQKEFPAKSLSLENLEQ